eukprot:9388297-Pyramimonas_sp.AAC.1
MGDGTNRAVDMEVTQMDYSCGVSAEDCNSITGNFLQGQGKLIHRYGTLPNGSLATSPATPNWALAAARDPQPHTLWGIPTTPLVRFTSMSPHPIGRPSECVKDPINGEPGLNADGVCTGGPNGASLSRLLNNNADGRFRLEMEVWLKLDGNTSPLAFQIPLLPVARGASPADTR